VDACMGLARGEWWTHGFFQSVELGWGRGRCLRVVDVGNTQPVGNPKRKV
jgi:hypothetical protein